MASYQVTRKGDQPADYTVADASEIQYTDNDCVGDFKRGFNDDSVDRLVVGEQLTIKTRCARITVRRIS